MDNDDESAIPPSVADAISDADDARVIIDFAAGPPGVGPATSVGSGEYLPTTETAASEKAATPRNP